jgi:hypothetical protein
MRDLERIEDVEPSEPGNHFAHSRLREHVLFLSASVKVLVCTHSATGILACGNARKMMSKFSKSMSLPKVLSQRCCA